LAGDRDRSREFALRLRTALQYSSFASIQAYIREFSKEAGIEVSLAGAGASPPFNTLVIPRQIFVPVEHGQLHITGSLTRAIKSQLADGIKKFCFGLPAAIHPEIRLVIGLACATTMAMHHHLAKDRVGGGVFRSAPG
jgi:hypothetical protein